MLLHDVIGSTLASLQPYLQFHTFSTFICFLLSSAAHSLSLPRRNHCFDRRPFSIVDMYLPIEQSPTVAGKTESGARDRPVAKAKAFSSPFSLYLA